MMRFDGSKPPNQMQRSISTFQPRALACSWAFLFGRRDFGRRPFCCSESYQVFSVEDRRGLPKDGTQRGNVAVAYLTPNGGSHGNDLTDHVGAVVGGYGHLQSAGNASWPLYCRARIF